MNKYKFINIHIFFYIYLRNDQDYPTIPKLLRYDSEKI